MFFCPQLLLSQNFSSENGVSKLLQESLGYGVFVRGNYDSPYICDIDGNINSSLKFEYMATRP